MKYKKIVLPTILVSSSILVLYGIKAKLFTQTPTINDNSSSNSSSVIPTDQNNSNTVYQKLAVLSNRCRGCGKCARIDSEHFEMSGRLATVISTTNLSSSKLALAINNCPVQAITLE